MGAIGLGCLRMNIGERSSLAQNIHKELHIGSKSYCQAITKMGDLCGLPARRWSRCYRHMLRGAVGALMPFFGEAVRAAVRVLLEQLMG